MDKSLNYSDFQGNFFGSDRPAYMNYGGIGWVIGKIVQYSMLSKILLPSFQAMRSPTGLMTRADSMMMRETSRTGGKTRQKVRSVQTSLIYFTHHHNLIKTSSWTRPSASSGSTGTTRRSPSTRSSTGSTPRERTSPTTEVEPSL